MGELSVDMMSNGTTDQSVIGLMRELTVDIKPRQSFFVGRSLVFVGYNHIILCNGLKMGQPINNW